MGGMYGRIARTTIAGEADRGRADEEAPEERHSSRRLYVASERFGLEHT